MTLEAVASGNAARLTALLAADAVAYSDGGGAKLAARNPIRGADRIARFFIGIARKQAAQGRALGFKAAQINGAAGVLVTLDGALDQALTIETDGARISAIYAVLNPEKLGRLAK